MVIFYRSNLFFVIFSQLFDFYQKFSVVYLKFFIYFVSKFTPTLPFWYLYNLFYFFPLGIVFSISLCSCLAECFSYYFLLFHKFRNLIILSLGSFDLFVVFCAFTYLFYFFQCPCDFVFFPLYRLYTDFYLVFFLQFLVLKFEPCYFAVICRIVVLLTASKEFSKF